MKSIRRLIFFWVPMDERNPLVNSYIPQVIKYLAMERRTLELDETLTFTLRSLERILRRSIERFWESLSE